MEKSKAKDKRKEFLTTIRQWIESWENGLPVDWKVIDSIKAYMDQRELFLPYPGEDPKDTFKYHDRLFEVLNDTLEKEAAEAKDRGSLVGCYFYEGVADGRAWYRVIRENKNTCRVKHIPFMCGDEYTISTIGWEGSISKAYVQTMVHRMEALDKLFGPKKVKKATKANTGGAQ